VGRVLGKRSQQQPQVATGLQAAAVALQFPQDGGLVNGGAGAHPLKAVAVELFANGAPLGGAGLWKGGKGRGPHLLRARAQMATGLQAVAVALQFPQDGGLVNGGAGAHPLKAVAVELFANGAPLGGAGLRKGGEGRDPHPLQAKGRGLRRGAAPDVDQEVEEDPDHVHEVPVPDRRQRTHVGHAVPQEAQLPEALEGQPQQPQAGHHVEAVEAGEGVEQGAVAPVGHGVGRVAVLVALAAQEQQSGHQGEHQSAVDPPEAGAQAVAHLRRQGRGPQQGDGRGANPGPQRSPGAPPQPHPGPPPQQPPGAEGLQGVEEGVGREAREHQQGGGQGGPLVPQEHRQPHRGPDPPQDGSRIQGVVEVAPEESEEGHHLRGHEEQEAPDQVGLHSGAVGGHGGAHPLQVPDPQEAGGPQQQGGPEAQLPEAAPVEVADGGRQQQPHGGPQQGRVLGEGGNVEGVGAPLGQGRPGVGGGWGGGGQPTHPQQGGGRSPAFPLLPRLQGAEVGSQRGQEGHRQRSRRDAADRGGGDEPLRKGAAQGAGGVVGAVERCQGGEVHGYGKG
jgi:hypothetical protein